MDSIKGKVDKVISNRKRLLELKADVLRLEDIIRQSESSCDENNTCVKEYDELKKVHIEARQLINELEVEKTHWREISKLILNEK